MAAKKTFEQLLKDLEQIIHELESEELPLEKALKRFEEGVKISKLCSDQLDEVEQKITVLLKDQHGNVMEKPMFPEDKNNTERSGGKTA